jgi:Suppressor of fused protein (SUFU)
VFKQELIDPRWLTEGVFECPPSGARQNWLYVSSGLSNSWNADSRKPNELSGLGCEFILECPHQSRWALLLLRRMVAFQILLSCGGYPGKGPLQIWDRIPLRAPIDRSLSALNCVLLIPSPSFGEPQQLPSGRFQFMQFVGITDDEAEYARENGGDKLLPP